MSKAGRSAQRRYERLAERRRGDLIPRLIWNVGLFTVVGVFLWSITANAGYGWGPWLFFGMVGIAVMKSLTEPTHVRSWAIGAKGERETEGALERLPEGFIQLHDRRFPGSRANIDHVVIGPTGVFVVESKRMSGPLRVRGDTVYVAGRRTAMVDEVLREVHAVRGALAGAGRPDTSVHAILFVQKADPPWFLSKPAGIPIVFSGRRLRGVITEGQEILGPDEVGAMAAALEARLPPMVHEPYVPPPAPKVTSSPNDPVFAFCPHCNSEMVLRRNRQGQKFLGCSQFPRCRGTRPWRA